MQTLQKTKIGLPVPQGFTISTEACTQYYEDGRQINDEIVAQIYDAVRETEAVTERNLAMLKIRFWYLFVQVQGSPCLA